MQFFKHDSNMINDVKIQVLMVKHGAIAYAVYCATLETITASINENSIDCSFPYASLILAKNLMMDKAQVENILATCIELGLLEGEPQGIVYCKKILTRLNQNEINPNLRKAVKKAKETPIPENYPCDSNHEIRDTNHNTHVTNISTEKEREIELDTEVELDTEQERENLNINLAEETNKNFYLDFAQDVFNELAAYKLPCSNNNFLNFFQREFYQAMPDIRRNKLKPDEILIAVRNYGAVKKLELENKTWYSPNQTFNNFCKKTILNFLPGTFDINYYMDKKPDYGGFPDTRQSLLDGMESA